MNKVRDADTTSAEVGAQPAGARTAQSSPSSSPQSQDHLTWFRLVIVAAWLATLVITAPLWEARPLPRIHPVAMPNMVESDEIDQDTFEAAVADLSFGEDSHRLALGDWQHRVAPPNLPLIPGVQVSLFWAMAVCLALCLRWPAPGAIAVSVLLVASILMDQMRIQPEFVSLTILLWATLPSASAQAIGRAHLASLYFFAGLHKLLSMRFFQSGGSDWKVVFSGLSDEAAQALAVLLAVFEVALGCLILLPATRKAAAWMALGMHLAIFLSLSPLFRNWNMAVWPWNLALATAGFALVAPWKENPWTSWHAVPVLARIAVALLLVTPVGYYAGWVDAYLAHCLYARNTLRAQLQIDEDSEDLPGYQRPQNSLANWSTTRLGVPFPPAERMYAQLFQRVGRPGWQLQIRHPRFVWTGAPEDDNLRYSGTWTLYYENGQPAAEETYLAGQLHGPSTIWTEEGQVQGEGEYHRGKLHGKWSFWTGDGKPIVEHYEYGQLLLNP